MNLFFDTSALVKYFHPEAGTEQVTALIQDEANTIWLSELARLAFFSALFRRFRARELDEKQLATVLASFETTLVEFHVEPSAINASMSATVLGRSADNTSHPSLVTNTLSSMRMPIFHHCRGTSSAAAI